MGRLVKNELFKLRKKNSTWIMILLMFAFMILSTIIPVLNNENVTSYALILAGGSFWLGITLISAAGSILSMEYEYGTIKELFASKYSRGKILISKWLAIFVYSILLNILLVAFTAVIYVVGRLINKVDFNWTDMFPKTSTEMWVHLLKNLLGSFISTWLILSVVFLIASLIKKSSLAVILGLVLSLGSSIIGGMLSGLMNVGGIEWLKYLPFNMLFVDFTAANNTLYEVTHLNSHELAIGALIYTVVFLFIGLLFYRRKEV